MYASKYLIWWIVEEIFWVGTRSERGHTHVVKKHTNTQVEGRQVVVARWRIACPRVQRRRRTLGYPHLSTSIFISKKEYSILVIKILYSILISFAPVLSLSHTLYQLFHILFPFLSLSLSPQLSLSLIAGPCSKHNFAGYFAVARCGRANAKCGVAGLLRSCGAHSLTQPYWQDWQDEIPNLNNCIALCKRMNQMNRR
jgi:hypothetical protein